MTAHHRFGITLAVIIAALFGLALCGYQNWERDPEQSGLIEYMMASAQTRPEICMDDQTREEIRALLLDGLSEAMKSHIEHTYEVWLKDDTGQPGRARNGVERGIRAYMLARKGAVEWSPPTCSG